MCVVTIAKFMAGVIDVRPALCTDLLVLMLSRVSRAMCMPCKQAMPQ